ncbi:MAG TPA: tetratricopeptide repeat protein [Candidatus Limnocylindria bacterium]|nr:tetratricopeptide repeat protein [Candidatus Limnocylindria bacterium]
MAAPLISFVLLIVACFTLATRVGPSFEKFNSGREDGPFANTLGESRRVLANHFFTRSDIYFHSGYYPSIFDQANGSKENHLAESAGAREPEHADHDDHDDHEPAAHVCGESCAHGDEHNFLGRPKDPMDAFTRNFFVSQHTHLTEKGTNGAKDILPWIKLSAKFNPRKVETYTVGAYWLRDLNKHDEAEQFLREGLRANPQSYEIMLELGRAYFEKRDHDRARNILEMAMAAWREQENPKPEEQRNRFVASQIVNFLAVIEDRAGNRERAIKWLEIVKTLSPYPEEIDKRIAEVRSGKSLEAGK